MADQRITGRADGHRAVANREQLELARRRTGLAYHPQLPVVRRGGVVREENSFERIVVAVLDRHAGGELREGCAVEEVQVVVVSARAERIAPLEERTERRSVRNVHRVKVCRRQGEAMQQAAAEG